MHCYLCKKVFVIDIYETEFKCMYYDLLFMRLHLDIAEKKPSINNIMKLIHIYEIKAT
jgi:hypothetical protein